MFNTIVKKIKDHEKYVSNIESVATKIRKRKKINL